MEPRDRIAIWLVLALSAVCLAGPGVVSAQQSTGATFGDVIQLPGGTPSDIVLDEPRQVLYLVNNSTSTVSVVDYTTGTVVNTIGVGKSPVAGALSRGLHGGNFVLHVPIHELRH